MLNITTLNNTRDQKLINKYEIYSKVLNKCHHRIITASNKGDSNCFYVIPEYILKQIWKVVLTTSLYTSIWQSLY